MIWCRQELHMKSNGRQKWQNLILELLLTVEFSKDGGKSWEKVEENVPNTGKYVWKVPKVDSAQCKIRVFSQYRPIYRGTSETFTVK